MKEALVWLLAGSEIELKEEFLNNLKSSAFNNRPAQGDYDFFHAQEITQLSSIIAYAYTYPLLAAKRIIVIKNIELLKEPDRKVLLKYLDRPASTSILVLDTALNDLRGEFWHKLIQKAQVSYFKPKLKREAFDWILKEAKRQGKDISGRTAQALQDKLGSDLATLRKVIEQLTLYVGQRKEITIEDVELLVGQDYLSGTFDLLKAINQRQLSKAIGILNGLWTERKGGSEVLGLLTWHFRRILKIKKLKQANFSPRQIAQQLNIKSAFQLEILLKEIQIFSLDRLKQMFDVLAQADLSLRSHRNLEKYILEFLLVRLCQGQEQSLAA